MSGANDIATPNETRDGRDLEAPPRRSAVRRWLAQDWPFILMLVLALLGVSFRLSVDYWVILTPVFGVICVIAGWRQFETRQGRLQLIYTQALNWIALMVAVLIMYSNGVQGVLNVPATALAMMTLLGLGTFTAGLQARVWRICAVGVVLFIAVPGIGWVKQSVVLLVVGFLVIVAIGAVTWWAGQGRREAA